MEGEYGQNLFADAENEAEVLIQEKQQYMRVKIYLEHFRDALKYWGRGLRK